MSGKPIVSSPVATQIRPPVSPSPGSESRQSGHLPKHYRAFASVCVQSHRVNTRYCVRGQRLCLDVTSVKNPSYNYVNHIYLILLVTYIGSSTNSRDTLHANSSLIAKNPNTTSGIGHTQGMHSCHTPYSGLIHWVIPSLCPERSTTFPLLTIVRSLFLIIQSENGVGADIPLRSR